MAVELVENYFNMLEVSFNAVLVNYDSNLQQGVAFIPT